MSVLLTTTGGTPVQASYIALEFNPTPAGGEFNPLPSGSTNASGNGSICFTYLTLSPPGGGSYTLQLVSTVILVPSGQGQATSNTLAQTPGVPAPSLPVTVSASTSDFTVGVPFTITVDVSDGNISSPNLGLRIGGFGTQLSVQSASSTVGTCSAANNGAGYNCAFGAFGPGDTATLTLTVIPTAPGSFDLTTATTGGFGGPDLGLAGTVNASPATNSPVQTPTSGNPVGTAITTTSISGTASAASSQGNPPFGESLAGCNRPSRLRQKKTGRSRSEGNHPHEILWREWAHWHVRHNPR